MQEDDGALPLDQNQDPVLDELFNQLPLPEGAYKRDLTIADLESFIAFDDESFFQSETPPDHRAPNLTNEEVREGMERGDIIRGIFDADNKYIASMWFQPNEQESDMYVYSLNVEPSFRDKGVGAYLLETADQEAKSRGYKSCSLHVDPLNTRGIHLYLKHGYRIVKYETETEHGLNDWVIMQKDLEQESPSPNVQEQVVVNAGDESGLKQMLTTGYVGTDVLPDQTKDPKKAQIVFAKAA